MSQLDLQIKADGSTTSRLKSALDHATAELERLRRDSDLAGARCRAADAALEQAKVTTSGSAASVDSPASSAAQSELAAKDELHLAESAAIQRLASSDEYRRAYAAWDAADRRVQALRQQQVAADSPDMKNGVAACGAARAQIETMRGRALDSDPAVRAAHQRLERTGAAVGPIASADEQHALGAAASVATLDADLRSARDTCASIATALTQAQRAQADAQAAYQRQVDASTADRQEAARLDGEVASLMSEVSRAQKDVEVANANAGLLGNGGEPRAIAPAPSSVPNAASGYFYAPPPPMSYGPSVGTSDAAVVYLPPSALVIHTTAPPAPTYSAEVDAPYPYQDPYDRSRDAVIVREPIPYRTPTLSPYEENLYRTEIIRRREVDFPGEDDVNLGRAGRWEDMRPAHVHVRPHRARH
jgi:hypothetical protein